jgi:hypothetical protein
MNKPAGGADGLALNIKNSWEHFAGRYRLG